MKCPQCGKEDCEFMTNIATFEAISLLNRERLIHQQAAHSN